MKAEFVLELGLLEGATCSNCEVGVCTVPRSPMKGAKMVDKVDVYPISLILLKFLYLSSVPLVGGSHRVHRASKFQKDTVFTFGIKRNSIGSPAVKGGGLLRC